MRPIELRGWRVVRTLGTSEIATTALIVPLRAAAPVRPRVLRLFSAGTSDARVDAEVTVHDALGEAVFSESTGDPNDGGGVPRGRPHWVQAESLVSDDEGRFGILLEAIVGPRAASWLDDHAPLRLGHVTTLLAPIADAVHRAHDVGVLGVVPDLRGVRIDQAGTPILVRLHHAVARPPLPERFRRTDDLHEHDRRALAQLVQAVALHVDPASRSQVERLTTAALDSPRALWESLMHGAKAEPLTELPRLDVVRLQHPQVVAGDQHEKNGGRDAPSAGDKADAEPTLHEHTVSARRAAENLSDRAAALRARLSETLQSLGLPDALRESSDSAVTRVVTSIQRLGGARRHTSHGSPLTVRPQFLVLAAAGVLAVVIAVAAAAASGEDGSPSNAAPTFDAESIAVEPLSPSSSATTPSTVAASESGEPPEVLDHPEADEWDAIVQRLLERWSACRTVRGDGCIDDVAQPRSAAAVVLAADDDDRHGVIDAWLLGDRQLVVVEQMGSAVLVDLLDAERTSASLLLLRSEAGWRVRDVLD